MKTRISVRAMTLLGLSALTFTTVMLSLPAEARPSRSSSRSSSSFGSSRSSSSSGGWFGRRSSSNSSSSNRSSGRSGGWFGGLFGRRSSSSTTTATPVRRTPSAGIGIGRPLGTSYGSSYNRRSNRTSYAERHINGVVVENKADTVFTLRTPSNRIWQVSGARKPVGFSSGDQVAIQGRPYRGMLSSNRYEADTIRIVANR